MILIGNKKKEDKTMKKIVYAISAIAVLLGFTACTSENEIAEPQVSGKTILKAYTETSTTRTALEDDGEGGYNVVWSTGDEIKIGEKTFTLNAGAGTTSGTFEGDALTDGDYTAFYPATYDGTNWPTTQTYAAGNITGSPMKATFTYTEGVEPSLSFKNEGGILRLTAKGEATVKSITVNATELTTPITLDCGTGVALTSEGTLFHIAMPANTTGYTGVTIELTDDEGKVCVKKLSSSKNLVINRSQITPASFTASSFDTPAGTILTIDGREGIVVDLGGSIGKIIIATKNEGASTIWDFGDFYTYHSAIEKNNGDEWGNGWKMLKKEHVEALASLLSSSATYYNEDGKSGTLWKVTST